MRDAFQFEHGGRTYSCYVEKLNGPRGDSWWWFTASNDGHRYAPFQAAPGDTRASVRARLIAYHTNLLARRAAPALARKQWSRPAKGGAQAPARKK